VTATRADGRGLALGGCGLLAHNGSFNGLGFFPVNPRIPTVRGAYAWGHERDWRSRRERMSSMCAARIQLLTPAEITMVASVVRTTVLVPVTLGTKRCAYVTLEET